MPAHRFVVALLFAVLLSADGFAVQSGSRNGAPVGNRVPQSFAAPSFQQPSPGFQQPGFGQSVLSQPTTVLQQPGFQPSVPAFNQQPVIQPAPGQTGFNFSDGQTIPMQQNIIPGASMPTAPMSTGGRSGAAGIPDSSLVDPVFQINNPGSMQTVDHSSWDYFLSRYLTSDPEGVARVCYGSVSCEDRQVLQGYLQKLQSIDVRALNQSEQLAYWFNLYNAKTVSLVLDNYPIRSVRRIKQKFTDFVGPFDDEGAVTVLGKPLSLNDIESGIIRPVFNDPRIHYALNCASYGCPNLSPTAWSSSNLNAQLDSAAYQYINSDRAVKRGLLGVRVSKIYKWYESDFGGEQQGVLNHIRLYADANTLEKINCQQSIRGYFYDWSLNDARVRGPRILESLRR